MLPWASFQLLGSRDPPLAPKYLDNRLRSHLACPLWSDSLLKYGSSEVLILWGLSLYSFGKWHFSDILLLLMETQLCSQFWFVLQDGWGQAWETKSNQVGFGEEGEDMLRKALSHTQVVWKRDLGMLTASSHPGIPRTGLRVENLPWLWTIYFLYSAPTEVPRKLVE